jgi:DNA-binding XRE family transcriptional regulator
MPAQNTKPTDYPQAVLQQIALLAQNIAIARKRRRETQAQWAERLGVSQPTMARIERGDPSVSMASYVMCMWLINQAHGLADLIAPQNDLASLEQEVARTRPRSTARASVQQRAKAEKKSSAKPASSTTKGAAFSPTSQVNAPTHSPSHLAGEERSFLGIDQTDAAKRAARIAARSGHEEQIKRAMGIAGLAQEEQIKKAMQIAGLGDPERAPNSTAAGLAALISGQKKARP